MELRPGTRLRSAVCETNVIVLKPPRVAGEISCGGVPMVPLSTVIPILGTPAADARGGTQVGKRYSSLDTGLEVLCAKSGAGSLAFDTTPLVEQANKPLPPSD